MAFFPDTPNLRFRFTDNVGRSIRTLEVQGRTYSTSTAVVTSATAPGPSGMFLSTPSPSTNAVPRHIFSHSAAKKSGATINLKVLQAKVIKHGSSCKIEFKKIGQIFTQLTERTASVPHILDVANNT